MSRTPSTRELAIVTALSAALIGLGGAVAVRPDLAFALVPALESLVLGLEPEALVFLLSLALLLLAPTMWAFGRTRAATPRPLAPEEESFFAGSPAYRPVGRSFEGNLSVVRDEAASLEGRERARERVVESLRPIAATAYANRTGLDPEAAATAVEEGTWTDDRRAAAFLATEAGPSFPLALWLVDLARGDPFDRCLERTLVEIERLQEGRERSDAGAERRGETEPGRGERS